MVNRIAFAGRVGRRSRRKFRVGGHGTPWKITFLNYFLFTV